MPRIVIFSGDLAYAVRKGIVELDRRLPDSEWLIVKQLATRNPARLVRNQWRNFVRNGWRWPFYQASEVIRVLAYRARQRDDEIDAARPGSAYTLKRLLARRNVQYLPTRDIHNEETLERVRRFAPDLGLALAAPILKQALFALPRLGTLNLHKGRVPDYRGMPPAFWELWNDEAEVGCTVHRVTAALDKGDVVAQANVSRQRYSTVRGLQLTLDELGIELTCTGVAAVLSGMAEPRPQPLGGRTYTKPTLGQIAQLRRRLAERLPARQSIVRRIAKTAYLMACLYFGRLWLAMFSDKPTITVVLYHRVTDELRDSLTTGIEQFERQMALLRRHCHPVSIEDIIAGRLPRHPARPLVCVTFDDGYKDNFATAAPLLLRHQISAAFFVSTGFIGTARQFPHDEGKVASQLAKMTWDDLRQMKSDGFTIGSHTVSHINCAKEPTEIVQRELRDSMEQLRTELDLRDVILAYPFGGREHMTPERLELVKQAGYLGCLSAYGGFNRGPIDRYNILRGGVNWGYSDLAFRCRIAGIV